MSSTKSVTLTFTPDEVGDQKLWQERLAEKAEVSLEDLPEPVLLKKTLDARRGRVRFHLTFATKEADAIPEVINPFATSSKATQPQQVVIVGTGPAGLFCALELRRLGIRSHILERGKRVQPRRKDLKGLNQHGIIDPESNYCFGEGGAGTYSDGKLYTRATKRGDIRSVLETLVFFGAPDRILTDARPHIGSNKLPKVISAIREELLENDVTFSFETRWTGFDTSGNKIDGARFVRSKDADPTNLDESAAKTTAGDLKADALVLATGHSARDVYQILDDKNVLLETKPFALGVRIEHPQKVINQIQYGRSAGHPALPSAAYSIKTQVDDHAVFSFCMCPGGFIVPAATEIDGLVVNGMSLSKRDSPFANSGLVVEITLDDIKAAGFQGAHAGVHFQNAVEQAGFSAGERGLKAPASRVTDFIRNKTSSSLPETSYRPGLVATDLREVLNTTGIPIAEKLASAMKDFDHKLRGYLHPDAVFIGVESRTSAPVRVPRDTDSLMSPSVDGLFPAGEGAGYAGGIMSAALDGMRVARKVAEYLGVPNS
ncbi:MAG: FAD-binding protein [Deltaproteobacteria bacterium]|nr:FAD-binding protein [Deltaproteobacteria bacterium]